MRVHQELREIARTLNEFCIVEISVLLFFCWQSYELLHWYMSIMTAENMNGTAFWGAMTAIAVAIFTAVKHINETFRSDKYGSNKKREEG